MHAFSVLLIRVLAIYLVVSPLYTLAFSLQNIFTAELESPWLPVMVTSLVVPLLIGAVLWLKAPTIAQKIHQSDTQADASVDEAGLVRAGSFLIGVYLFVQQVGNVISRWEWGGGVTYASLAVLILSLALMLGSSFLQKLFYRFKHF
ncbi:hypothetical protein [Vreelandella sp. EE7]